MTQQDHPAAKLLFETGTATHVGKVRSENEDSFVALPDLGLWAVADGMGGHSGGRFASQTLVRDLASVEMAISGPDMVAQVRDRALRANTAIRREAEAKGNAIIGTTMAAVVLHGYGYACLWAGDSRVYLLRNGILTQVSRDHAEAQELIDRGVLTPEQAKTWPRRNVITRAVGVFEDPEIEVREGTVRPRDTFLLCSDGLTGHLSDAEIAATVAAKDPQAACDTLIEAALERGGSDNVTVIIVRCHPAEATIRQALPPHATS